MKSKIRVLDEHTINKIAAGEVIENPASVVKELTENSIDAGSTEICIEIKTGGRQLIRISDNGCGMSPDDALLCLERHATSKIRSVEEIFDVYTMGFRGEAIPSIASISKFTLITSTEEGIGTMVIVEGGKIRECTPAARSKGTTVEVKTLFFNIPVRRKFQKSPNHDSNDIFKMISTIALGHPKIHFHLISDQKTLLKTTSISPNSTEKEFLEQRIKDVLGNDFLDTTCYIFGENAGIQLQGFTGLPAFTRNNRTGQYTFINKRSVNSLTVSYAVREAYGTSLSTNRYPVYILQLTLPGQMVDVNVHPQKKEVRLRQEQILRELITQTIREGIHTNAFANFQPSSNLPFQIAPLQFSSAESIHEKMEYIDVLSQKIESPQPSKEEIVFAPKIETPKLLKKPPTVFATLPHYIIADPEPFSHPDWSKEGFCIIDQKAAHSRIIYEKLLETEGQKKIEVQTLLIPHTFHTTPFETPFLLPEIENIRQQGIHINQIGPNTFNIDAMAPFFNNCDLNSLIQEILQLVQQEHRTDFFLREAQKRIAQTASASSLSSKSRLQLEEAESLLTQLMLCTMPFQCPNGKSTIIYMPYHEIQKRF